MRSDENLNYSAILSFGAVYVDTPIIINATKKLTNKNKEKLEILEKAGKQGPTPAECNP